MDTSNSEVEQFIKAKYLNKQWANSKMSMDPVRLYYQDREEYERYV